MMESFCSLDDAVQAVDRRSDNCKVEVQVIMKKLCVYENQTDTEVEIVSKITKGLFTREKHSQPDKSANSTDVSVTVEGIAINIVQVEVIASYPYSGEFYHEVMTEKELQSGEEITTRCKIPPKSKLIRWQLAVILRNEIIGFGKFIDTNEDLTKEMKESVFEGKAVIHLPRKIIYGKTQFRIKHKGTNKYLIPVLMENNWDSLTLKANPNYYFHVEECSKGVRIKALNCTHPEHCYVYSNDPGMVFLKKIDDNDTRQIWIISKSDNLRNGDVVTFRSRKWETADLCHQQKMEKTNVFCRYNMEDEWILEMRLNQYPIEN